MQLLYNDENLDVEIQFLIKRLEILQTDPPNLERSYNIDKYLASFCKVKCDMILNMYNWNLTYKLSAVSAVAGGGEPGQRQRPPALGPRRHPDRAGRARAGPGPGVLAGGGPRPRVRHVSPGLLLHRQRGQTLRVGLRDGARDRTQVITYS